MAGSIGLNTGLKALLSSRFVLDTIGHNISNANTPGYSRQSVDLAAASPLLSRGLLVGSGVDANAVRRTVDTLLQRRLLVQTSARGSLQARFNGLSEIETLLREPDGTSIGARIDDFFAETSNLATNPSDSILRTGMANSAVQLTSQLNQLATSLSSIRRDSAREAAISVGEVNDLASEISGLNREIASAQSAGLSANDLLDRRDHAISKLSEIVDVSVQEDPSGAVRLLVSGSTLVSTTRFHRMRASTTSDGEVTLRIEGADGTLEPKGGSLGGLVSVSQNAVPDLQAELDRLARNLIRQVNRVHTTGVPGSGPYSTLVGSSKLVDVDKDGSFRDELLSNSGLPFEVKAGELFVNVTDESDGSLEKHSISISRTHTTVGDFLDGISAMPHLSADIDALGRVQIVADAGFGFDFSSRLDHDPDEVGSFGGGAASLSTPAAGPFALADGDVLELDVGGTSVPITFQASDFADVTQASAEEIAAVIAADPGAQANGITASAVGDRLAVRSVGSGSAVSFDVVGGSALAALGWSGLAGTSVTGHDNAVSVELSGRYNGEANEEFTFVAAGDGTVGTTPGLTVDVFDSGGQRVATLDVGAGYVPGSSIEVANGISVGFGLGELSATHNDAFSVDAVAESDTGEVLVAMGLGSFFSGGGAADIAVNEEIALDPSRIASSATGTDGDNGALSALLDVEAQPVSELGGASLGEFYGETVGRVGFQVSSTVDSLDANEALIQSLELRRESASGVNVDEELVNLLEFEQSFAAASRYITVLNELNDDLLSLI